MQHSRSSWDITFPLDTELPTPCYISSLVFPHWWRLSFAQLVFCPLSSTYVAHRINSSGMVNFPF